MARLRAGIVLVLAIGMAACGAPPAQPDLPTQPSEAVTAASTAPQPTAAPLASVAATNPIKEATSGPVTITEYPVAPGSHPHDVAPEPGGGVWFTAQNAGQLGLLDPATGAIQQVALGRGSRPHGVIVGPDGAAWVTDGGQNAIVRVDGASHEVKVFPLPPDHPNANLNTAAFDTSGILWFTGQAGVYGRLDPTSGDMQVFDAPRGTGPYGITATPAGEVFYASLAGSYLGQIDPAGFAASVIEPPTPRQGARRAWADSAGKVWVSEWTAGQVARYDPADRSWKEWHLPGPDALAYAVYVDERDKVWLSDFASNAIIRFDPLTETFDSFSLPTPAAQVRQILGRPGEVWGAESGPDKLVVLRTSG